jgi:hypothetical protein
MKNATSKKASVSESSLLTHTAAHGRRRSLSTSHATHTEGTNRHRGENVNDKRRYRE